jgi:hypothetical protein
MVVCNYVWFDRSEIVREFVMRCKWELTCNFQIAFCNYRLMGQKSFASLSCVARELSWKFQMVVCNYVWFDRSEIVREFVMRCKWELTCNFQIAFCNYRLMGQKSFASLSCVAREGYREIFKLLYATMVWCVWNRAWVCHVHALNITHISYTFFACTYALCTYRAHIYICILVYIYTHIYVRAIGTQCISTGEKCIRNVCNVKCMHMTNSRTISDASNHSCIKQFENFAVALSCNTWQTRERFLTHQTIVAESNLKIAR